MTTNHNTTSLEVRTGALAAIQVIQTVERLCEQYHAGADQEKTPQEALQGDIEHRLRVVSAFLDAAGELPPKACGFVSALAEYIDFGFLIGEPDMTAWKPEAAMTDEEIKKVRADRLADMLAN